MNKYSISVSMENEDIRVDKLIAESCSELTRSAVQKLIENGNVFVNGRIVTKNYRSKINDIVEFEIPKPVVLEAVPQNIPVDILYEDDDLLIVNKPKGMVVHPAAGNPDGTGFVFSW